MVGNEEKVDGKEEKSWINLFSKYYGGKGIPYPGRENSNADTIVLLSSFDFLRSGYYVWYSGGHYDRAWLGYYWSVKAYLLSNAHLFYFAPTWLVYQDGSSKGNGFSLRCVAR